MAYTKKVTSNYMVHKTVVSDNPNGWSIGYYGLEPVYYSVNFTQYQSAQIGQHYYDAQGNRYFVNDDAEWQLEN